MVCPVAECLTWAEWECSFLFRILRPEKKEPAERWALFFQKEQRESIKAVRTPDSTFDEISLQYPQQITDDVFF